MTQRPSDHHRREAHLHLKCTASARAFLLLTALLALPTLAQAQSLVLTGGPSFPQDGMGARRTIGGQISLALGPSHTRRGFTYRGEVTKGWFPTRSSYAQTLSYEEGTLTVGSALAYLLYTGAPGPMSWHVGVGAGAYDMDIPGHPNPYGFVAGVGVLAGVKLGTGRVRGLIELQQQAILSDYGTESYTSSTFVPLRFGVVIQ